MAQRSFFLLSAALVFLFSSQAAQAVTLANQQVTLVGVHANYDIAYFGVQGDVAPCTYGLIYLSLASNGGKAAYATILAARNSGIALTKVEYVQIADGSCKLEVLSE